MTMKSYEELPGGYKEKLSIKLQNDKKTALTVNILALVVGAVMIAVPLIGWYRLKDILSLLTIPRTAIILIGYVLYIYAHELTHGFVMKKLSGVKATYGFTGLYAYAGSSAYFRKAPYIIIALAPLVLWGAVLTVIQILVPDGWGIVPYIIQIGNIAGSVGDIYVALKITAMDKDILVNDTGIEMTVYSKE